MKGPSLDDVNKNAFTKVENAETEEEDDENDEEECYEQWWAVV